MTYLEQRPPNHDIVAIDDASFKRLSELVREETGIVLGDSKRSLVVSRLSRRLRDLAMADFSAYARYVGDSENEDERRFLTSLLTTNVTRFFREEHHFRALAQDVLPPLIARAKKGGRVRFWSAGCSTGEEPYSIAMQILEVFPEAARHDVRILATDIDPKVIEAAKNGRYKAVDEKHLPQALAKKYFQTSADASEPWQATDQVRKLVTFGELNLLRDWPMQGQFDVIFCRNVVIYFDQETQAKLWLRFAKILAPDGHLFVGHSERAHAGGVAHFKATGITQYTLADPPHAHAKGNTQ